MLARKKRTLEDSSHGDDPTDALASSVRSLTCFVRSLSSLHPADRQVLSKTGLKDENVTFTTRLSTPLPKVIEYSANRAGDEPLLTASHPEYLMEMRAAAEETGVNKWLPSEARHSGASVEVGLGPRSLADGQKQGHWASTVSLNRHDECGELYREWQRYSGIHQWHFVACEIGISAALMEGNNLTCLHFLVAVVYWRNVVSDLVSRRSWWTRGVIFLSMWPVSLMQHFSKIKSRTLSSSVEWKWRRGSKSKSSTQVSSTSSTHTEKTSRESCEVRLARKKSE